MGTLGPKDVGTWTRWDRAPTCNINIIRILQSMMSSMPLILGLGTRHVRSLCLCGLSSP